VQPHLRGEGGGRRIVPASVRKAVC